PAARREGLGRDDRQGRGRDRDDADQRRLLRGSHRRTAHHLRLADHRGDDRRLRRVHDRNHRSSEGRLLLAPLDLSAHHGRTGRLHADFDDCVMPITPMFHVLSWGFPQNAVAAGAKLVLPGKFAAEEFGAIGQAFIDEKVTLANGAPAIFAPMLAMMKDMPQPPDLSGVRLVSGSSEPPLSMMRGFKEITGAEVIHGYG